MPHNLVEKKFTENLIDSIFKTQLEAFSDLRSKLNGNIDAVIDLICNRRGKLVFSGIGKSGETLKKSVATFNSLGLVSIFLNPTNATHGDLGAVCSEDIIILLSKSGNSEELAEVISWSKFKKCKCLVFSCQKKSNLAKTADYFFQLPNFQEFCVLGLAPTTSSVIATFLFDLIAVLVSQKLKISKTSFYNNHPSGVLGLNLTEVSKKMHVGDALPLVSIDKTLGEGILEMTEKRFGCVGITDKNSLLVGIFTDGDLRRQIKRISLDDQITNFMTPNPKILHPSELMKTAAVALRTSKISAIFICSEGRPLGILHLHDVMNILGG